MSGTETLENGLRLQGRACAAFGSPFSAALLERAADDLAGNTTLRGLLEPWRGVEVSGLFKQAMALRLLGALHDLALSGDAPALAAAYPAKERAGDAEAAWRAAAERLGPERERLARFLEHEPQTNEVRRSACLLPGFLTLTAETGLPLRCFELGASAGLNQLWDQWRYDLGPVSWGREDATLTIATDWRGPPPALPWLVTVIKRAACDRKPIDLTDPVAGRRLRAYVWPDQLDRLERLDAAISAALEAGVKVEAADAVDWAAARAAPGAGAATVLFHSVFWQYLPAPAQGALTKVVESLGARAGPSSPFAWLRMEPRPADLTTMEVRLRMWPGGHDRLLARGHPHGAWVDTTAADQVA